MNIFELLNERYKLPSKPKLFEAFSGIGCQRMAFNRLGLDYESVGISEIDKYAIQSYMAIHGDTKNFGSICDIKGTDLPQIDVFTWSFPCTDLSKAGKQKGLDGTRSGLVYEVLRIMQECKVNGNLPKVLIMENVVDLIQVKFIREFQEIQLELENLGYTNYTQTLNAKDYGVAQNRDRVFMVSILGDYYYEFPKPIKLEKRLKDYLESEVDPKYYLSDKMLSCFTDMTNRNGLVRGDRFNPHDIENSKYAFAITTLAGNRATDNFIKVPEDTKQGYAKAYDGDGVYINRPHQKRGVVQDGMIQTLKTTVANDVGVVVYDIQQKVNVRKFDVDVIGLQELLYQCKKDCKLTNKQISEELELPLTLVEHWFRKDKSFSIPPKDIWKQLKELLNINTNEFDLSITEFIEQDGVYEKSNRIYGNEGLSPTLTTDSEYKIIEPICLNSKVDVGVVVEDIVIGSGQKNAYQGSLDGICSTLTSAMGMGGGQTPMITENNRLRIRKLTPLECWRLMGIDDEDFNKASKVCSNAQLYKQAGNGIVVDVFASIISTML